jgi:tetratricopeptide (TPR) repeat protein
VSGEHGATATPNTSVDPANPWLGLASFTEETRDYFHGREEEVAELARRVQRKLLTVLFGQSGLGKTSILRAGLVPRLRGQGYCPVYVRIDYAREAPEPADQIKQAIARSARRSGEWTQAGVAVEGESLWEYLHHRDDVLQDEAGQTLIPLLIFDQFEEIFTLAQTDDFGRARAARLVTDLADLVENRPPRELEAKLEQDDAAAERFDFARSDYRVLIALREDYLAPLESLKGAMPSITQNRLRLAPMTGTQALAAVLKPGKGLVSDEVAAAIVRFVAGGAEIANAEVEPSLLSLICRELNDTRIVKGSREISLDLLDGSQASILSNFYERSLADQPPAVRRIIEDELLTESGFRENVAEESLLASFKATGAAPDTLATLVNRRLLRIEERLDVRRVELTHDVLCGVVKSSRDLRHERESRDATERLLADQRAREVQARRALVRARQIAGVCALLAIAAVAAAAFAILSTQRARRAETAAQEARAGADQARSQAEHLLGYLSEDFSRELETFGRLDAVEEMTQRQIDYFHAVPVTLRGPETIRNGASAMTSYARAARYLGNMDAAGAATDEAVSLLQKQHDAGDRSEATTIALANAIAVKGKILSNASSPLATPTQQQAVDLLKPLATAPGASYSARRAYAEALVDLGFEQGNDPRLREQAVASLELAMRVDESLGARELKELGVSVNYAEAGAWEMNALIGLGRFDDALAAGNKVADIAAKVVELRPDYRGALHAYQIIENSLGDVEVRQLRPEAARPYLERSESIALAQVKLDPKNTVAINNLGVLYGSMGDVAWMTGRTQDGVDYYRRNVETVKKASRAGSWFVLNALYPTGLIAERQADMGNIVAAHATLAEVSGAVARLQKSEPAQSKVPMFAACYLHGVEAGIALLQSDGATARRAAQESQQLGRALVPDPGFQELFKQQCIYYSGDEEGEAEFMLGNYAAAERTLRAALDARNAWPIASENDTRDVDGTRTVLALAVARQGRLQDAAQLIAPVVKFHRELAARNHGDGTQTFEFARAVYVEAICEPAQRAARLHEAAALIDGLPAALRTLSSVRLWRERINDALTHSQSRAS